MRSASTGSLPVAHSATLRPSLDIFFPVAAGVQHFRAVQAAVNKIRGEIHQSWPLDSIGAHQRHIVLAQEVYEFRDAKTLVSDFQRVAQFQLHTRTHIAPLSR